VQVGAALLDEVAQAEMQIEAHCPGDRRAARGS
jgi:hypothetical protein